MAENEGSNLKLGVQSFPGNILLSERRPERGEGEATQVSRERASQAEGMAGAKAWGQEPAWGAYSLVRSQWGRVGGSESGERAGGRSCRVTWPLESLHCFLETQVQPTVGI